MLAFVEFISSHAVAWMRFVLPPSRCLLCLDDAGDGTICKSCAKTIPSYSNQDCWRRQQLDNGSMSIISVWPYSWPLSAVQQRCKFSRWRLGGAMLAADAAAWLKQQGMDWDGFVLVPSPMHWRRRLSRGSNHAELQARVLARELGLPVKSHLLKRVRSTPRQVGLPRQKRLTNLKRTFVASKSVAGKNILLFDDIMTTGSTMRYMAEAFYAAGAQLVVGVSLMRVDFGVD